MQKNENVSEKRLLLDFTIYQSNIVHSNYNLCPGYRFERLRDYARVPRPAARAESRNLSKQYLGHKLHAKRSGCGHHF